MLMFDYLGKDYISQVKLIVGVLGTPSESVLKKCHHDILKKMIKGETAFLENNLEIFLNCC